MKLIPGVKERMKTLIKAAGLSIQPVDMMK
jgi:hypothetical protein